MSRGRNEPNRRPGALWTPRRWRTLLGPASAAACALALLVPPVLVHAHGKAHVHGVAELRVTLDGEALRLVLTTPLENLVGFERAPRDEAERDAIRRAATRLRDAAALYTPSAGANCVLREVSLASPAIDPALLGGTAAPASGGAPGAGPRPTAPPAKDDHVDLEAVMSYRCANPAALREIEVNLLKAFTGLRRIDAQVAGPTRQSVTRLTGNRRAVDIR